MEKVFVYGMSVEGENFTDRVRETHRLKLDFENGINVVLISPRRIGKSSLVRKVMSEISDPQIEVVFMDIYDCRSEYDFYNRYASSILKATATKTEQIFENIKRFLIRLTPKISFNSDPMQEVTLSLGITPQNYQSEEILALPEIIAKDHGTHIIICIDEFQQIGEFEDSITIQKKLRSSWQHMRNVSFCLFGSKKHLMTQLFQNRKMPFYQFGEMMFLDKISTDDWVAFIQERFQTQGKSISAELSQRICLTVENNSSYVQQLAWNVLAETDQEATETSFQLGMEAMMAQCTSLFEQQIQGLSSYQMNFIKAVCDGKHKDFGVKSVLDEYHLGSRSNIIRIKTALLNKELIEENKDGVYIEDPVFRLWFKQSVMMK